MSWIKRSSRVTRVAMLMSLVVVGMVAGTALTAIGAPSSNTINACVNRYNGDMRVLRTGSSCASTEYAMSWESYGAENLDGAYVNEGQADSIDSSMIVDGEIQDGDLSATLKTQFEDAYVNNGETDSVTSGMIKDGEIQSADLSTALNGDLDSAYVNAGEADSLTSGMIVDGQVAENDLSSAVQTKLNDSGGLTNVYNRTSLGASVAANGSGVTEAYCDEGDIAIAGGGISTTTGMQLVNSHRYGADGWRAMYKDNGGSGGTFHAHVVCATP